MPITEQQRAQRKREDEQNSRRRAELFFVRRSIAAVVAEHMQSSLQLAPAGRWTRTKDVLTVAAAIAYGAFTLAILGIATARYIWF